MRIFEDLSLTERKLLRMCRSKKKRIRKKWLKNQRNYKTVPMKNCFVVGDDIICHPVVVAAIRKAAPRIVKNAVDQAFASNPLFGVPNILEMEDLCRTNDYKHQFRFDTWHVITGGGIMPNFNNYAV